MSMEKTKYSLGAGLVILSSLFYASYGIWTTLMGDFFGGFTASAIRSVLVLMILLPIAYIKNKIENIDLKNNWKKLIAMVSVSTLVWGLLYYSVLNAGIGLSFTVNYASIIIGMLFFGWLLAGEKFTTDKKWSASIGIVGLLLVYFPSTLGDVQPLPLIAAVISGLAVAANTVLAKQLPYNTTMSAVVLWGTSVIANVPMMFILKETLPALGPFVEWFYLIMFAVASVLASWLLLRGMKYIEAGTAGILGLMEIVFGIIFGIVLFNESIESLALVGVVVIILAAAFPYIKEKFGASPDAI